MSNHTEYGRCLASGPSLEKPRDPEDRYSKEMRCPGLLDLGCFPRSPVPHELVPNIPLPSLVQTGFAHSAMCPDNSEEHVQTTDQAADDGSQIEVQARFPRRREEEWAGITGRTECGRRE